MHIDREAEMAAKELGTVGMQEVTIKEIGVRGTSVQAAGGELRGKDLPVWTGMQDGVRGEGEGEEVGEVIKPIQAGWRGILQPAAMIDVDVGVPARR